MQWEDRILEMRAALHRLEELETVSPFSRTFYQLICDWIEESGPLCAELQEAFGTFLASEIERHRAVNEATTNRTPILEWVSVRYRAEPTLQRLIARLEAIPSEMSRQESLRQLILSECYAQLGDLERVVSSLRAALATGAEHPIVHFAVGYSLYMLAMRRHVRYDAVSNRYTVENRAGFQRLCEQATESLQAGFTESPFDAQLYWWIGCVQESLGNLGEARDAYKKAKEADPANFGSEVDSRLRDMPHPILDAISDEERERLSQLPPITNDEVLRVQQQLKRIRRVTDLMQDNSHKS